jgi:hypothetical protein
MTKYLSAAIFAGSLALAAPPAHASWYGDFAHYVASYFHGSNNNVGGGVGNGATAIKNNGNCIDTNLPC